MKSRSLLAAIQWVCLLGLALGQQVIVGAQRTGLSFDVDEREAIERDIIQKRRSRGGYVQLRLLFLKKASRLWTSQRKQPAASWPWAVNSKSRQVRDERSTLRSGCSSMAETYNYNRCIKQTSQFFTGCCAMLLVPKNTYTSVGRWGNDTLSKGLPWMGVVGLCGEFNGTMPEVITCIQGIETLLPIIIHDDDDTQPSKRGSSDQRPHKVSSSSTAMDCCNGDRPDGVIAPVDFDNVDNPPNALKPEVENAGSSFIKGSHRALCYSFQRQWRLSPLFFPLLLCNKSHESNGPLCIYLSAWGCYNKELKDLRNTVAIQQQQNNALKKQFIRCNSQYALLRIQLEELRKRYQSTQNEVQAIRETVQTRETIDKAAQNITESVEKLSKENDQRMDMNAKRAKHEKRHRKWLWRFGLALLFGYLFGKPILHGLSWLGCKLRERLYRRLNVIVNRMEYHTSLCTLT